MIIGTVAKCVELAGVEIMLQAEFAAEYGDFGYGDPDGRGVAHHDWGCRVDSIGELATGETVGSAVWWHFLAWSNPFANMSRKRRLKMIRRKVRQVKRELSKLTSETVFSGDDVIEAAYEQMDCDGDYEQ